MGSIEKDLSYEKDIQKRYELLLETNNNKRFQDRCQKDRRNRFLKEVVASSPFYNSQELDLITQSSIPSEHFSQIPLLEKSRLKEMSDIFIAKNRSKHFFKVKTAGTTGIPLKIWFDHEYFISYYSFFRYFFKTNKLKPSPFSVSLLSFSSFRTSEEYWILQPTMNYSFSHRMSIHPSRWESAEAVLRSMSGDAPMVLVGLPSSFEVLIGYLDKHAVPKPIHPDLIITRSETLLPPVRTKIEEVCNAPVFDSYGLTELGGIIGIECKEHKGFHINTIDFFVEIIDQNGKPVKNGIEGEIVVTNLYHRIMPLLRYKTEDYGVMTEERCTCGSVSPRILKLTGRKLNKFSLNDGSSYHPYDAYGEFLWRLPVSQFQMVQQGDSLITLNYKSDKDISGLPVVRALDRRIKKLHKDNVIFRLNKVDFFKIDRKFQAFLKLDG